MSPFYEIIILIFNFVTDDDFVTYEIVDTRSKLENEDTFLPDMVFIDKGNNVRLKRQLRPDGNPPGSHLSPEDEDKMKAGRKKVPSGFNTTSTTNGKPSKFDGPSSGKFYTPQVSILLILRCLREYFVTGVFLEKKAPEKSPSLPKSVAAISIETSPAPINSTVTGW